MSQHARWSLRTVPTELARRYVAEGWWTDDSLGDMVTSGLEAMRDEPFVVHSAVRPWRTTRDSRTTSCVYATASR